MDRAESVADCAVQVPSLQQSAAPVPAAAVDAGPLADSDAVAATAALMPVEDDPLISFQVSGVDAAVGNSQESILASLPQSAGLLKLVSRRCSARSSGAAW